MTKSEVLEAFKALPKEQRQEFLEEARTINQRLGMQGLTIGSKVSFVHTTGATIKGTLSRMKQKYAEVISRQNKYGVEEVYPIRWSVSPSLLKVEA